MPFDLEVKFTRRNPHDGRTIDEFTHVFRAEEECTYSLRVRFMILCALTSGSWLLVVGIVLATFEMLSALAGLLG